MERSNVSPLQDLSSNSKRRNNSPLSSLSSNSFGENPSTAISDSKTVSVPERKRRKTLESPGYLPNPYPVSTSTAREWHQHSRGILASKRRDLIANAILDDAEGFPYCRKLEAHASCVNAVAFSSKDGRFLASGGDDLRILLWDFHQDDVKVPSFSLKGPRGNIFCLEFSANNRYLFSAGTCERIYQYDLNHLMSSGQAQNSGLLPTCVHRFHNDSVRAVTCHPIRDEQFMSASEDGTIRRHDERDPSTTRNNIIRTPIEMTGVQYHPTMEHLFVTSEASGRVLLRDARMAFGPLIGRSNEGIVQKYNTTLTKKTAPRLSRPETSSVIFDREGTKMAVTFLHYYPTIYSVSDPDPIAVLSGQNLPDGTRNPADQRTYSNSCTMKHGSFGGPGDDLYAGGSDDFRCYVWKIPPVAKLMAERKTHSATEFRRREGNSTVAFTESTQAQKTVPVEISTPLCRLTGHNSIVNNTIFHPHLLHLVTAGVDKNVVLHSSTASSPCTQDLPLAPANVRQLKDEDDEEDRATYVAALGFNLMDVDCPVDLVERRTLSLFDHLLREEGHRDVFDQPERQIRSPDSDSSDEEEDNDMDSDA